MKYGLPARYWLYTGGYDYRKNLECLITAYAATRARHPCPPLVLAGKIPTDLRKPVCDIPGAMTRANLTGSEVLMPGFIDDNDMAALYSGSELFVYPSLAEGFGLPPLEAMACGCPALAANATSLPEVVVDEAYRFSPFHPGQLTDLLGQAARSPLPVNPGFDRFHFSEARGVAQYCGLLERMIT